MTAAMPKRRGFFNAVAGRQYSLGLSVTLAAPLILLLLFAFLYPIGKLMWASFVTGAGFTPDHYLRALSEPVYLNVLWRTIRIAFVVTIASFLLGYPVAYAMNVINKRFSLLIVACVLVPLWTSILVRSYAWIVLLQRNGIFNPLLREGGLIDAPLRMIYTEGAVMVAMTHVLLPFMILPIYSSLQSIPPDFARAARNLGAGATRTFLHVTLPLSLPGIYAGSLMTFILALGFYITPALLGGPSTLMMATVIGQQTTELLNWPFAGALSGVLLGATLLLVIVFRRVLSFNREVQFG
jgi:mannopine transport system permease protein